MILENELLKVEIASLGAEVRSIYDKALGKELMWSGHESWWTRVSPVLFPIVGGVHNNEYRYNGQTYTMPSHGFLRDSEFTLESKTEDTVWYIFESNETTLKIYPFEFKARLGYKLIDNAVEVLWNIENTGSKELLFSIGAHPAFLATTNDTLTVVARDVTNRYLLNEKGIQKGYPETVDTITITPDLFINDALIYDNVDKIIVHTKDRDIAVSFTDFEYVGIWSKYVDGEIAPFVCIEPWMGIADFEEFEGELQEKTGIQELKPQESVEYKYTIEVK